MISLIKKKKKKNWPNNKIDSNVDFQTLLILDVLIGQGKSDSNVHFPDRVECLGTIQKFDITLDVFAQHKSDSNVDFPDRIECLGTKQNIDSNVGPTLS